MLVATLLAAGMHKVAADAADEDDTTAPDSTARARPLGRGIIGATPHFPNDKVLVAAVAPPAHGGAARILDDPAWLGYLPYSTAKSWFH